MRLTIEVCDTRLGEYPEEGMMVLWNDGGEMFVGGYEDNRWFAGDEVMPEDDQPENVVWCYLPDLRGAA